MVGKALLVLLLVGANGSLFLQKSPNTFEIDATCGINEVRSRLALHLPDSGADTIGGAVISFLGHIPKAGESITLGRHKIKVLDADARRIRKLLVEKTESPKIPNGAQDSTED